MIKLQKYTISSIISLALVSGFQCATAKETLIKNSEFGIFLEKQAIKLCATKTLHSQPNAGQTPFEAMDQCVINTISEVSIDYCIGANMSEDKSKVDKEAIIKCVDEIIKAIKEN